MITCKEDLINTYIKNDFGELRHLYIKKAIELGFAHQNYKDREVDWYDFGYIGICTRWGDDMIGQTDHDDWSLKGSKFRKLNLSDLKPRTKVEYEKVEYNHAWEIVKLREEGVELFKTASDELQIEKVNVIALRASSGYDFYRKVERPAEWWEDPASHMANIHNTASVYNEEKGTLAVHASMTRDQWCDFARILLEQEGE